MIAFRRDGGRIRFAVRVTPRAARAAVGGSREGALLVRVTAAPADGRANAALIAALAKAFGLARSELHLEAGASARSKVVSAPARAQEALERLAGAK